MINHGSRKYVDHFQPQLGSDYIPSLKWADRYKYLGVQMGRERLGSPAGLIQELLKDVEAICASPLADWQKVNTINTFILSKANYYLSASTVDRTWCIQLDAGVRRLIKRASSYPKEQ